MSLNKLTTLGGQNSGRENWMNLSMNNLEAENVTLKGNSVLIETQDNAGFNNFSTPNLGMPNFVLATDGAGNTSWLYLGDIDPSPSDPNLYTKTQNIDLVGTIPGTTQINGATHLDVVTANSIELDGSDLTDKIADLELKTTDISYNPSITTTTISNTLNNTGLIHAAGNVQVGGNLQVQTVDANLLNYKTPNLGTAGQVLTSNGLGGVSFTTISSGSGDVVGPSSSVNNTLPLFDGTTGKLLKNESTIVYNSVDSQLEVPKISSTQYKEGTYDGSLIKNFPVGSNNSFTDVPPSLTSATDNTYIGTLSGQSTTSGSDNSSLGVFSLADNISGSNNTSIGTQSMRHQTLNFNSTAVGYRSQLGSSGSSTGNGINNSLGSDSLLSITTGYENTAIGSNSGQNITTGYQNTLVGNNTGNIQTGFDNTLVGYQSRTSSFSTSNSIAIGANTTSSTNQAVIGNNSITELINLGDGTCNLGGPTNKFKDVYGTTYHEGTYSGSLIKNFPVGSNNTFSFFTTPPNLTATSDNNTFYGLYAGDNVTDSDNSTCIGVNAMRNSLNGGDRSENTIIGKNAGQGTSNSTFNNCVMLGSNAGQLLVTGNNSTFIGQGAGNNQTTGDNNTLIGRNATTAGGNKTNAIAIGWEATVLNDNQVCIGNGSVEKIYNEGNGTCDLGSETRQFKDLYMAGNIYGSYMPVITRFRITNTPDRPPVTGTAIYEDNYIRLGWDQATQNDVQFQKKTSTQYVSTCSITGSTSVNISNLTTTNLTYELNGPIGFVGGQVITIIISPTNSDTARSYRIQAHYTEDSLGVDGNIDFIVERFDKCGLV